MVNVWSMLLLIGFDVVNDWSVPAAQLAPITRKGTEKTLQIAFQLAAVAAPMVWNVPT